MLRKWLCQAEVKITIEPVDPILIKSGYATIDGADMVPVSTFKEGERVYYLPGSSLKGALRSHLERIARTLQPGRVCIPYYDPDPRRSITPPVPAEAYSHGCGFRSGANDATSVAYADSCAVCRMFGSLKFGGRFSISDAYPSENLKPELRNGVGINRFTGGTVPGVLFDLQVLVGGKFKANLRLTNFELWQLAALNLLLIDMKDEIIMIGSGRSRGLGRVRIIINCYHLTYLQQFSHLQGLYQLATSQERSAYRLHDWAPPNPINLPNPQSRGLRQQYDLSNNWSKQLEPLRPAFEKFLPWSDWPQDDVEETDNLDEQEVEA